MSLRDKFPEGRFAPPAHPDLIKRAEIELGVALPQQLHALYLECDGFREPKGNAKYLLPLFNDNEDMMGSLVTNTRFWWTEWKQLSPETNRLDFTPFVFFWSSCGDENWGGRWQGSEEIIAYHHSMEDEYEVAGTSILDVYQVDFANYGT